MLLRFSEEGFDPNNGARGQIPVIPLEWKLVGLDTDLKAYNLLKYLYGFVNLCIF